MATYKGILTNNGKALLASATVANPVNYSHLAVGDGNGSTPTPLETRSALVNEKARIALNVVEINPNQTNQIICEAIIPTNIGGFHIREFGLFAGSVMIVNGNYPLTYKPAVNEGGAREIAIKVIINVQNAEVIALYLDDSLIYATREWVKNNYIPRADIIDNLTTNDATKPVSAKQAKVLHDNKAEKTTTITAGTGLSGGGNLSANRTLSVNYGTTAGTAAQGNDSRLSNSREWTAETVSQAEAESGTNTTRRAWTAQRVRQAATAMFNAATTVFTRTLLERTNAAQVRGDLELGTAATCDVTTSNTDSTANRLLKVGDFGCGRTAAPRYENWDEVKKVGGFFNIADGFPATTGIPSNLKQYDNYGIVFPRHQSGYGAALFLPYYTSTSDNIVLRTFGGTTTKDYTLLTDANFNPSDKADKTTTITAGTGLSGGGNLSANRTLSVNYGTASGTVAQGNDSRINNGQTAFGWGNHASAGYALKSYTDTELNKKLNANANAVSATKLQTPVDIETTSFDGSSNILIDRITSMGKYGFNPTYSNGRKLQLMFSTLSSNQNTEDYCDLLTLNSWHDSTGGLINAIAADKKGTGLYHWQGAYGSGSWSTKKKLAYTDSNVASASKLQTARTIALSGGATGSTTFDGSYNATINVTEINASNINSGTINAARVPTLNQDTTGNAATATVATRLRATDNRKVKPSDLEVHRLDSFFTSVGGMNSSADSNYADLLTFNGYSDSSGGLINALLLLKGSRKIYHYQAGMSANVWGTPSEIAYTSDNVASASKLQTPRNISLSGAVTGSANFDGSGNINIATTLQQGLGVGQTYQNMTASRAGYTNYVNNTGRPIMVVLVTNKAGLAISAYVNDVMVWFTSTSDSQSANFIVPSGSTYKVNINLEHWNWLELR